MNKLLRRQIEKSLGSLEVVPQELGPLFDAISDAYDGFDEDRNLIERSLDISSSELSEINQRLRKEVAERKAAEDKLQHTVSLLTATLDSTTDGILVVDREGRIQSYNDRFKSLWQLPDSVLEPGRDDLAISYVLSQLENPEAFVAKVQQLYGDPRSESSDFLLFKDGRVFERYSRPQSVGDDVVGRVWSFRDVTLRVEADRAKALAVEELAEANRTLEKVNKELRDFAHIVSHDLKAPLRSIKTLTGWISADCGEKLSEDGKQQMHLLVSRVDRMRDLIDGILQYSRLGGVKEERVPVDLNGLVRGVVDMLAPPSNIQITVQEGLPTLRLEPVKVGQVFQNLLSNAIKYMDKPEGRIHVACTEEAATWRFSVADNGPGIEEKYFEKIFQMFQTLSPRDTFESTGVGLTIVKKIVETYQGTVWVESQMGVGSTFLFTLPKEPAAQEATPSLQSAACNPKS
jgi:two-component system sensor kinase FixL